MNEWMEECIISKCLLTNQQRWSKTAFTNSDSTLEIERIRLSFIGCVTEVTKIQKKLAFWSHQKPSTALDRSAGNALMRNFTPSWERLHHSSNKLLSPSFASLLEVEPSKYSLRHRLFSQLRLTWYYCIAAVCMVAQTGHHRFVIQVS